MSANKYDILKEKFNNSNLTEIDFSAIEKANKDNETSVHSLEEILKNYDLNLK